MNEIDEQSRCGITKTSRRFRACCRTREVRRRMTILCSGWPLPTGVLSRHPIGDHAGWNPRCRVLLQHLLRVGFAVPRVGLFFLMFLSYVTVVKRFERYTETLADPWDLDLHSFGRFER